MPVYYLNERPQPSGEREVHTASCAWLPNKENRIPLGNHPTCHGAIHEARKYYQNVDGCAHCCPNCHTR